MSDYITHHIPRVIGIEQHWQEICLPVIIEKVVTTHAHAYACNKCAKQATSEKIEYLNECIASSTVPLKDIKLMDVAKLKAVKLSDAQIFTVIQPQITTKIAELETTLAEIDSKLADAVINLTAALDDIQPGATLMASMTLFREQAITTLFPYIRDKKVMEFRAKQQKDALTKVAKAERNLKNMEDKAAALAKKKTDAEAAFARLSGDDLTKLLALLKDNPKTPKPKAVGAARKPKAVGAAQKDARKTAPKSPKKRGRPKPPEKAATHKRNGTPRTRSHSDSASPRLSLDTRRSPRKKMICLKVRKYFEFIKLKSLLRIFDLITYYKPVVFSLGNIPPSSLEAITPALKKGLNCSFQPIDPPDEEYLAGAADYRNRLDRLITKKGVIELWNEMKLYQKAKRIINLRPSPVDDKPDALTNAGELLLQKVRECIQAHPRRFTQDMWIPKMKAWLTLHPEIKIAPTDKNLGTCVLPLEMYNEMVHIHLDDAQTYQHMGMNLQQFLTSDIYKIMMNKRSALITFFKKEQFALTWLERKILTEANNTSLPPFYLLIKVHKPMVNELYPTRPICGSFNCPSTSISLVFNTHLLRILNDPANNLLPAVLRDSLEFVDNLKTVRNYHRQLLVTFDVVSLYPNINIEKLLAMFRRTPCIQEYTRFLSFILKDHYLVYVDQVYKQIQGVTMGNNSAPTLANFYLACLIDGYLLDHPHVSLYKRFIDDGFLLWEGNQQELDTLFQVLNTRDPLIRLTYETSPSEIPFLDVTVYYPTADSPLHWKTHVKVLSKHLHLDFDSFHSPSIKKGIIKGELVRFIRNSSNIYDYLKQAMLFKYELLRRGYPLSLFNRTLAETPWTPNYPLNDPTPLTARILVTTASTRVAPKTIMRHIRPALDAYQALLTIPITTHTPQRIRSTTQSLLLSSKLSQSQIDLLHP